MYWKDGYWSPLSLSLWHSLSVKSAPSSRHQLARIIGALDLLLPAIDYYFRGSMAG